jgi:hypothetical protein
MRKLWDIGLTVYFLVVFVGIGGLQMYRVNAGWLTSYGADLLAPPYLYVMFRSGRLRLSALTALAVVLGSCFLWEWLQRYDLGGTPLGITHGTFDPVDLLAYTVGLLATYVVDVRWSHPRRTLPSSRAD